MISTRPQQTSLMYALVSSLNIGWGFLLNNMYLIFAVVFPLVLMLMRCCRYDLTQYWYPNNFITTTPLMPWSKLLKYNMIQRHSSFDMMWGMVFKGIKPMLQEEIPVMTVTEWLPVTGKDAIAVRADTLIRKFGVNHWPVDTIYQLGEMTQSCPSPVVGESSMWDANVSCSIRIIAFQLDNI